jgi:hypothetical protein
MQVSNINDATIATALSETDLLTTVAVGYQRDGRRTILRTDGDGVFYLIRVYERGPSNVDRVPREMSQSNYADVIFETMSVYRPNGSMTKDIEVRDEEIYRGIVADLNTMDWDPDQILSEMKEG